MDVLGAIENSGLATWVRESGSVWAYPMIVTFHSFGLALVVGLNAAIDLRVLGFAPSLPLAPMERLFPWMQYIDNRVFWAKLTFIGLAGINVLLFYVTGLSRRVDEAGADDDVPDGAKLVAAVSLFLWFGVIFWGRMLPFLGGSF